MSAFKVLITHRNIPKVGLDLLKEKCELIFPDGLPYPSYEQILAKVKGVHAVLWFTKYRLDEGIVNAAGPQLKVVGVMAAGIDNIDVELLKSRGIKLSNTPNVINDATANVAVLLGLAAGRRMVEGRNAIVEGTWTFGLQWLLGQELTGSKIGIVGLGGIGQTIAKRLNAFDVSMVLYSGHKKKPEGEALGAIFVDFDRLLVESDYIFVACPLTDETRGMFNKEAFKKMKKTCVFVNISRGEVVNQEDLIEALKNKTIFAAGLDVMTPEPLPKDHELLSLTNCVLVPHIGTATCTTRSAMAELCAQNILRGLGGEPMFTPVF